MHSLPDLQIARRGLPAINWRILLITILACAIPVPSRSADQVYQVTSASQTRSVAVGGVTVPRQVAMLAAQVPGRVSDIAGKEGDRFKQGTPLVKIDDSQLLAQRREAVAAHYSAQAAARNAQVQYSRELRNPRSERATSMPGMGMPGMFDQMFTQPMGSMIGMENPQLQRDADLHDQGTQLSQAQSSVSRTQAKIEQIDAMIRDSVSIAPFDGVITRKLVENGDTVQPGQNMIEFADLAQIQIKADVPARLLQGLKVGQPISAKLDNAAQPITVQIAQIFPVADQQRHTITVKFDLPANISASPGMYAEVLIPDAGNQNTGSSPVIMIPRQALVWRGSLPGVRVVNKDGQSQLRLLRIKSGVNSEWVQVYAGLKDGERILVPSPAAAKPRK